MKKLGIIGGLGPDTTARYYSDVVSGCKEINNYQTPPIKIESVGAPYSLYEDVIVKRTNLEGFLPFLIDAAQELEGGKGGADFLVMPCNTLHVHIDEIRRSVSNIPIISITEETGQFLEDNEIKNIGIVSTAATIDNNLYGDEFEKRKIKYDMPNQEDQKILNDIVIRLVRGDSCKKDRESLISIINKFNGVDCVLLACTDLQLLNPIIDRVKIYDTMKILVNAAVREIMKGNN